MKQNTNTNKRRKLVYWVCLNLDGATSYNIRSKTKKQAKEIRENSCNPECFSNPMKVEIRYKDAFDLISQALGEGGCEPVS